MIFKRRLSAALLVLLCFTFASSESSDDFKFDSDDLQIVYSDPSEAIMQPPSRYLYSKELSQCPAGESKMMLTLLLQSLRWEDVSERKKEKAIKKLSRFFVVPRQFITVSDIHTPEILEMLKHSINKSNNLLNTKETAGRVEFMIGCGDKLFENGKKIAQQVNEHINMGELDELSGLPFNWWNIWTKHVKSRVQRTKRQSDGSGNDEGDEIDYDEDENEDDDLNYDEGDDDTYDATKADDSTEAPHGRHSQAQSTLNALEEEEDRNAVTREKNEKVKPAEESESNYDDEYDDTLDENENDIDSPPPTQRTQPTTRPTTPVATTPSTVPTTEEDTTTVATTTVPPTTTREAPNLSLSTENGDADEYDDSENKAPVVEKRIPKIVAIAGKSFSIIIDQDVFNDDEDKTDLELVFLDRNSQPVPTTSWVRFDREKREIYGLPLESDVSRYEFKLRAADKEGMYVDEPIDITVQQHKASRSVNHEIYIQVKLEKNYESPVDWQIRLLQGIVEAVGDNSVDSMVVRDVRPHKYETNQFTFVFTNETLPKDKCPKEELDELMKRMTKQSLNKEMSREITVRNVEKELIGTCAVPQIPKQIPAPTNTKNYPPTVRNAVDRVTAQAGQLLVQVVPKDTFYDPEDQTDLKLKLLDENRMPLSPNNWLQFDAKNREFYGVPTIADKREQNYILVAEDKNQLTTNDALVVEIDHSTYRRNLSAKFNFILEIPQNEFQNAAVKRKFIETVQIVFGDATHKNIIIKAVKSEQYGQRTTVIVQNATLNATYCQDDEIEMLKSKLVNSDGKVLEKVKEEFKGEFKVIHIYVAKTGVCSTDSFHHPEPGHVPSPDESEAPALTQDVLITYVLPTTIILLMLLIALLVACLLYKRHNTGKMELGDEEERKSFRSKGIPVIFQDELDEKPEIVTKSPVILKDEKPPLLPQYNGLSQDGDEDNMDQYIPPQPVMMGSRESRGKSPVTPSYRRPPPYVSP